MQKRFVAILPEWWLRSSPITRFGVFFIAAAIACAIGDLWYLAALFAVVGVVFIVALPKN